MLISVYEPQPAADDLTLFCISFGLSLLFCLHWCCVLQAHAQTTAVVIHKLDNTAERSPPCALATLSTPPVSTALSTACRHLLQSPPALPSNLFKVHFPANVPLGLFLSGFSTKTPCVFLLSQ